MTRKKVFIEQAGGVSVVNFTHSSLFNPQQVEEVVTDLMALVAEGECRGMVLDFGRVRSFSSAFLGSLLDLKRLCEERKVGLALTGLSERLLELMRKVHVDEVLMIFPSRAAAEAYLAEQTKLPGKTDGKDL